MKTTRDLPRPEWAEFLESFSRQHEGWLVRLETRRSTGTRGEAPEAGGARRQQPLESVSYLPDGGGSIRVVLGDSAAPVGRTLAAPRRLRLIENETGAHEGLEFDADDGTSLSIRFRSAILPEMVDGV
jgi:hypothetical protein